MKKQFTSLQKHWFLFFLLGLFPLLLSAQTIRYVKTDGTGDGSSWAKASADIQEMIDLSQAGDEVWVAKGTYKPVKLIKSRKRTTRAFQLKDGVSLYGGFEGTETDKNARKRVAKGKKWDFVNLTILDGDDDVQDIWTREIDGTTTYRYHWKVEGNKKNASHVVYGGKTPFSQATQIDGFLIQNGNANVWKVYAGGGGLMASGNIQVKNCIFKHNYATTSIETTRDDIVFYGGAVCILSGAKKAIVEDCCFEDNMTLMPTLSARGGGVYIDNGSVKNCSFKNCVAVDMGGGVYALGGSIENCEFDNCYAGAGGGIYGDQAKVLSSTIINCRSIKGGGIFNMKGTVRQSLVANSYACASEYLQSLGGGVGASIFNEGGDIISCVAYCGTSDRCGGIASNGGRIIACTSQDCVSNNDKIGANLYTFEGVADAAKVEVFNTISGKDVAKSNFVSPAKESGWKEPSDERTKMLLALSYALEKGSEFIDKGEDVDATLVPVDFAGNERVNGAKIDKGAYEYKEVTTPVTQEDISITFATTDMVKIGLGGGSGTSFDIDWGDGNRITYQGAKFIKETPKAKTIKIYGDKIQILKAGSIGVTAIKINKAPLLAKLFLGGNKLQELDVTHCPNLVGLYCSENSIKALDLSKNTKMRAFECARNEIKGTLDCSSMQQLTSAKFFNNKVEKLLLPSQSKLIEIDCDSNRLETIDVSLLPNLEDLSCSNNKLKELNLSKNLRLYELHCGNNELESVDLSTLVELVTCSMINNKLTRVDVKNNLKLENLYLQGNQLPSIDLSKNTALKWLNLENNKLTEVDFSMLPNLMQILLTNNQLSKLDISKNKKVNTVKVGGNKLSTLDLSNQKSIFWLICDRNNLSELDLSVNKSISWLECGSNQLSSLEVAHLKNLQKLFCDHNKLSQLDLSKNKNLQALNIANNNFTKVELDKIMQELPDVKNVEIHDNNKDWAKKLDISYNVGTKESDISIAKNKAWIVTAEGITAVEEVINEQSLMYFPVQEILSTTEDLRQIQIYNMNGEILYSSSKGREWNISALPKGICIAVGVNVKGEKKVLKFVR